MKLTESEAETHPVLAAPKRIRRREIARAAVIALLIFALITLVASAVLVDSVGASLFGH